VASTSPDLAGDSPPPSLPFAMAGLIESIVLFDASGELRWAAPSGRHENAFPRGADLVQFCFPEGRAATEAREHLFALTDHDGNRLFGFCSGGLHLRRKDEAVGYTIHGRGSGSCLCLLSRKPWHEVFVLMLRHIHGLLLLYPSVAPNLVKQALDQLKQGGASEWRLPLGSLAAPLGPITAGNAGRKDLCLRFPKATDAALAGVPILPLLQTLGAHKFLLVLSALLCERRIVFVSDNFSALSGWVLGALAALHPFAWHGVMIPLLPRNFVHFAAAPTPFVVGVNRSELGALANQPLSEIVWVDMDKPAVVVGSSPSAINGPSGTASTKYNNGGHTSDPLPDMLGGEPSWIAATGQSLANNIGIDLKEISRSRAAKVVKAGIRGARSWLQRGHADAVPLGVPGQSPDELADPSATAKKRDDDYEDPAHALYAGLSKAITAASRSLVAGAAGSISAKTPAQVEEAIRGSLMCFYVTLYGDKEQYEAAPFGSREGFNKERFIEKRKEAFDSKHLIALHREFVDSQMLEMLFEQWQAQEELTHKEITFELLVRSVSRKGIPFNVLNVQRTFEELQNQLAPDGEEGAPRIMHFHPLALQLTSSADGKALNTGFSRSEAADMLVKASFDSASLEAILRVLWWRLSDCRGLSWKRGLRALSILRLLLVRGPEAILGDCLKHIKDIREMAVYRSGIGYGKRVRTLGRRCLALVLDRARLRQRRFGQLHLGAVRFFHPPKIGTHATSFANLHQQLRESRNLTATKEKWTPAPQTEVPVPEQPDEGNGGTAWDKIAFEKKDEESDDDLEEAFGGMSMDARSTEGSVAPPAAEQFSPFIETEAQGKKIAVFQPEPSVDFESAFSESDGRKNVQQDAGTAQNPFWDTDGGRGSAGGTGDPFAMSDDRPAATHGASGKPFDPFGDFGKSDAAPQSGKFDPFSASAPTRGPSPRQQEDPFGAAALPQSPAVFTAPTPILNPTALAQSQSQPAARAARGPLMGGQASNATRSMPGGRAAGIPSFGMAQQFPRGNAMGMGSGGLSNPSSMGGYRQPFQAQQQAGMAGARPTAQARGGLPYQGHRGAQQATDPFANLAMNMQSPRK